MLLGCAKYGLHLCTKYLPINMMVHSFIIWFNTLFTYTAKHIVQKMQFILSTVWTRTTVNKTFIYIDMSDNERKRP